MSTRSLIVAFADISTEQLPDVHQLDARQQVLWVLTVAKRDPKLDMLTAAQISDILAHACGIAIARQRVLGILEKEKAVGVVAPVRRDGRAYFKIMHRGEEEILRGAAKSIFVDPARALTSIRAVEDILRSLNG